MQKYDHMKFKKQCSLPTNDNEIKFKDATLNIHQYKNIRHFNKKKTNKKTQPKQTLK